MRPAQYWTKDEDAVIAEGAEQGLTAFQIAAKLPGRSRNAVIGRMHRMGLGGHGKHVWVIGRDFEGICHAPNREAAVRMGARLLNQTFGCRYSLNGEPRYSHAEVESMARRVPASGLRHWSFE